MKIIFPFFFTLFAGVFSDYSRKELRCLVCRATINEMIKEIDKVSPKKKIQVGGYRIDETGNLQNKVIPFARSGMHLSELMDTVCKKMEDYVRSTDKKTKQLKLLRLMTEEGTMNPLISDVDIIQDSDLNKSLEFYCEGIVEEFEDAIYEELKEPSDDPTNSICSRNTGLCENYKDEL